MRKFFLIILCFVSVSAFAEKWHWEHDNEWKEMERRLDIALALKAYNQAFATGDNSGFKELDEKKKEKERIEYEPFTSPEPLKRFINTDFISDEGGRMTYVGASIAQREGEETLVLEFIKGWKIKTLTAKKAFEIITVEGHPFGQEKNAPNEEKQEEVVEGRFIIRTVEQKN